MCRWRAKPSEVREGRKERWFWAINGFVYIVSLRPYAVSQPHLVPQATMPMGSVMVWTGWSIHSAGVNNSRTHRLGLNINYCLVKKKLLLENPF